MSKQDHAKPDKLQSDGDAVNDPFIVAIGASAGGLEALDLFFNNCPSDTGAVYVVIQHLSPDHKSMMSDLLARYTRMRVRMVEDDLPIAPDQVFLIPPGTIMRIQSGRFQLTPKSPHLLSLPIDIFFTALADDAGKRAIGVVLSGTGSDGTRGAAALNAAGGFLLAQKPGEAKFDGMPGSVIATGLVDAVLPANKLAKRILSHINNLPIEQDDARHANQPGIEPLGEDKAREGIIKLLLDVSGIDFKDYKPATLNRRIERRMQVRHMRNFNDYFALLQSDANEAATLKREILIPVTSFFRDPDVFNTLTTEAIDAIIKRLQHGAGLRVWIAGCSTGEEAYSIAIAFNEAFERTHRWPSLKIFATDVNQHNIDFAGAGRYPESAAAELTPERLERFFIHKGNSYSVKPELRQCIVFARHNLLADPPFTRMSLVSCRNTLIYFTPEAQKRALDRLQYAIEPCGFLLLGSSESLAGNSRGFVTRHSKHKLFQRDENTPALSLGVTGSGTQAPYVPKLLHARHPEHRKPLGDGFVTEEAMSALVSEYLPPAILVNDHHEAIHLYGKVQPFFRPREGSASLELSRILPENLVPVASALLYKATKEQQERVSDDLRVSLDDGSERMLRLRAKPLQPRGDEKFTLLVFEPRAASAADPDVIPMDMNAETVARVDVLQRELEATRENLQATIEELETSNEELQATNEELMASNEELQSSNEELQSVNEELNTVNAEFQEKVSIINRINADLDSMSKAVGVATIFVDDRLNLTRFSPDAVAVFRLREGDVGRPLDEIVHVLQYPGLIADIRATIRTERMVEKQAMAADGRTFLIRILPYSIPSTHQHGAVASFVDITATRDRDRLQAVLDALPEHVAVLSPDGTIALINAAWKRFANANGDSDLSHSGLGRNYLDVCRVNQNSDGQDAIRAFMGIKAVLEGSSSTFSMQYPCHGISEKRWFVMNVAPIRGHEFGAVVSHVNITSW